MRLLKRGAEELLEQILACESDHLLGDHFLTVTQNRCPRCNLEHLIQSMGHVQDTYATGTDRANDGKE